MKWTSAFCLTCIFLCGTYFVRGEGLSQDTTFCKGDTLFAQGQYFEAGIAYERVYFYSEDPDVRARASLRKSQALKQQGEYARAVNDLQRSLPYTREDSLREAILYEMAFCSFLSGVYPQSFSLLKQLEVQYPEGQQPEAYSLLKGMVLVKMEDWEGFNEYLQEISAEDPRDSERDMLLNEIHNLLQESQWPAVRDPDKARMLSTFLPGSGHIYAGEPGQGILNGLSQMASLGTAVLLAYNQLYIGGFIVGLGMFQSFYFGGIRHAGELAEEKNQTEKDLYQGKLFALLIKLHQSDPNEP